jgi:hypothetical protein
MSPAVLGFPSSQAEPFVLIWQPPLPSHLPVSPQAPAAAAGQVVRSRGVLPDAMFEQVPDLPETLQL